MKVTIPLVFLGLVGYAAAAVPDCGVNDSCGTGKVCSHGKCCDSGKYYCGGSSSCISNTSNCNCVAPLVQLSGPPKDCGTCGQKESSKPYYNPSGSGSCVSTCPSSKSFVVVSDNTCTNKCPSNTFQFEDGTEKKCLNTCPDNKKNVAGGGSNAGTCAPCPDNEVQDPSTPTTCKCPSGMFVENGNCVATCTNGMNVPGSNGAAGTCSPCPENEVQDPAAPTTCKCPSGMFIEDGNCVQKCTTGMNVPGSNGAAGTCSPCPENQVQDSDPTKCTCPSGFFTDGDDCLTTCAPKKNVPALSGPGHCEACPPGQALDPEHAESCICASPYFLQAGSCVDHCDSDKQVIASTTSDPGSCEACDAGHAPDPEDQTKCICAAPYFLQGDSCVEHCDSDKQVVASTTGEPGNCVACDAGHAPDPEDQTKCICAAPYFLQGDSCVEHCDSDKQVVASTTSEPGSCAACDAGHAPDPQDQTKCICASPYFLAGADCVETCGPENKITTSTTGGPDSCDACDPGHARDPTNPSSCICASPYFLAGADCVEICGPEKKITPSTTGGPDSCDACDPGHARDSTNPSSCICASPYFLDGSDCVESCGPEKKITTSTTGGLDSCDPCDPGHARDPANPSSCICASPYFLDGSNCVETCGPEKKISTSTTGGPDSCDPCDPGHARDPVNPSSCICASPYFLEDNACVEACGGNKKIVPSTTGGPSSCVECEVGHAPDPQDTASCICASPYFLQDGNCVEHCDGDKQATASTTGGPGSCNACPQDEMPDPSDQTKCISTCPSTSFLDGSNCVQDCGPDKKNKPSTGAGPGSCEACQNGEKQSSSDHTTCACPAAYYVNDGQCVENCPTTGNTLTLASTAAGQAGSCVATCPAGTLKNGNTCITGGASGCPDGTKAKDGACTPICTKGEEKLCNNVCVSFKTDNNNCGRCTNVCTDGKSCVDGKCTLPTCALREPVGTLSDCKGKCKDFNTDPANCGGCGTKCAKEQSCNAGSCECPVGGQTLCGNACKSLNDDPKNCGGCGVKCDKEQSCNAGLCECPTGQSPCGNTCKSLSDDPKNCGSCGNKCTNGKSCIAGVCECASGLTSCDGKCKDVQSDNNNCGQCYLKCPKSVPCSSGLCGSGTN